MLKLPQADVNYMPST